MPTLAVHSFGNEHDEQFEAFYRPYVSHAGWFRTRGTLERISFEISVLLRFSNTDPAEVEFENRYGGFCDRGDYEKVLEYARKNVFMNE